METKYGLNFQNIPAEDVPFDNSQLEEFDVLENNFGQELMYFIDKEREPFQRQNYYKFINNDVARFISYEQMTSPWKKL